MSEAEAPASEAPPSKKPILQMMIAVLLAALLGLTAWNTFGPKPAEGPKKAAAHKEADGEEHEAAKGEHGDEGGHGEEAAGEEEAPAGGGGHGAAPAAKPTVKVAEFIVKLKDADDDRYAKFSFDLEVKNEPHKVAVTAAMPKVRDSFISYLSDRTADELRGSEGLTKIKHDLMQKLDEVVPHKVRNLYISDFVVQ